MKMIYLASPYSHKKTSVQNKRYRDITKVAAKLTKDTGLCFFLPITQSFQLVKVDPSLGGSFSAWRNIDLYAIKKSDEMWVVTMDGWLESIGVQAEIAYAKSLKKPVKYLDSNGKKIKPPKA